jgi:uncharacterized membrane protein
MSSTAQPSPLPGRPYPPPPQSEPLWPALLALLATIILQFSLEDRLVVGPRWLLPGLEGLLLIGLLMASPRELETEHRVRRTLALSLTLVVSAADLYSLYGLAHYLLQGHIVNGHALILSGMVIWLTNVIVFGLWYWEIDRGGPGKRATGHDGTPDFLFPQMTDDAIHPLDWRPQFVDYLYLSLTNATAFSPTDTMPLSRNAKMMMGIQSLASLVTLGLVISRAVNILKETSGR